MRLGETKAACIPGQTPGKRQLLRGTHLGAWQSLSRKLSITTWKSEKKKKKKKITNQCLVLRVQYKQAIVEVLEIS